VPLELVVVEAVVLEVVVETIMLDVVVDITEVLSVVLLIALIVAEDVVEEDGVAVDPAPQTIGAGPGATYVLPPFVGWPLES